MMQLVRACAIGSATGVLAACAGPAAPARVGPVADGQHVLEPLAGGALRITRTTSPFTYSDGLSARRAADALCGGAGVRATTYDRYANGAWLFPGGCA